MLRIQTSKDVGICMQASVQLPKVLSSDNERDLTVVRLSLQPALCDLDLDLDLDLLN